MQCEICGGKTYVYHKRETRRWRKCANCGATIGTIEIPYSLYKVIAELLHDLKKVVITEEAEEYGTANTADGRTPAGSK